MICRGIRLRVRLKADYLRIITCSLSGWFMPSFARAIDSTLWGDLSMEISTLSLLFSSCRASFFYISLAISYLSCVMCMWDQV